MIGDERKLCLFCAERRICEGKYRMPGGQAFSCPEYRPDVSPGPAGQGKRNVLIVGPAGPERTRLVEELLVRAGAGSAGYYTRVVQDGLFRSHAELILLSGGSPRSWVAATGDGVERQLVPLIEHALRSGEPELLVLDEVGALQGASTLFRRLMVDCFTSDKRVLATMSLGGRDEAFLLSLESRADVTVLPMRDRKQDRFVDLVSDLLSGAPVPQPEPAC